MYRRLPPTRYIPKGALVVNAKDTDAVAFVYQTPRDKGPCALIYFGKQTKAVAHVTRPTEADLAAYIQRQFESRREWNARKVARRNERTAQERGVEVGTILVTSWGYEQTNVNFYKVTALVGRTMATVQEVSHVQGKAMSSMSGTTLPGDAFRDRSKPMRVIVKNGSASIDGHSARVWDGKPVFESSWH